MNRRPTIMNDFQQTAFNTIDAINKNDEAKFYEGVAKIAEMKHVNSGVIIFEICKSLYDQGLELMHDGRNK